MQYPEIAAFAQRYTKNQRNSHNSAQFTYDGTNFAVELERTAFRMYPTSLELQQQIYFYSCVNTEGYYEFKVKGRKKDAKRLDGFYSKEIMLLAFGYLHALNMILGIKGVWRRKIALSKNFEQFAQLVELGNSPVAAANNCWTGLIAQELGYTCQRIVSDDPQYLWVYFE